MRSQRAVPKWQHNALLAGSFEHQVTRQYFKGTRDKIWLVVGMVHHSLHIMAPRERWEPPRYLLFLALRFRSSKFPNEDLDDAIRDVVHAILKARAHTNCDEFAI
jgi:hypothetical protein